ncbi:unnamed protein product [Ambrosiozyma monospora]|uniref:Unnamed protein product n=1 Tax=Ambrosiozyma monospora TaxID=43982 RepID=A0ACB5T9J2_AMBMO|nr:unnamed protein product [Ambrosiozyma monospora]
MNPTTFNAIVMMMMNERNLSGAFEMIQTLGSVTGFTLDQEYHHELTLPVISSSSDDSTADESQYGGEMFLFDEEDAAGISPVESSSHSYSDSDVESSSCSSSHSDVEISQQPETQSALDHPSAPITISLATIEETLKTVGQSRKTLNNDATPTSPSIFDNSITKLATNASASTTTTTTSTTTTNIQNYSNTGCSYSDEKFIVPAGQLAWCDEDPGLDFDIGFNSIGFNSNLDFNSNLTMFLNAGCNGQGEGISNLDSAVSCVGSVHNKNYNFIQLKKRLA